MQNIKLKPQRGLSNYAIKNGSAAGINPLPVVLLLKQNLDDLFILWPSKYDYRC